MAAAVQIRHVAVKPLPLQTMEGERLTLAPGEQVPAELEGRWLDRALEAGKIVAFPEVAVDASALSDAQLAAELKGRGYKVSKAVAKA